MDINVRKAATQMDEEGATLVTFTLFSETPQLELIMTQLLPEWAELFAYKNREYVTTAGSASDSMALGQKGQFSDIWRKIGKLKTGIWDGNEAALTSEGVDEITLDLIGHCFLLLELRRRQAIDAGKVFPLRTSGAEESSAGQAMIDIVEDASPALLAIFEERGIDIHEPPQPDTIVIPQPTSLQTEHGVVEIGGLVRFKQHLGKGLNAKVVAFDMSRTDGMIIGIHSPHEDAVVWVHPGWMIPVV